MAAITAEAAPSAMRPASVKPIACRVALRLLDPRA
jgi:hypothetical protein